MLVVLASASALYCYDAIRGSTHIYNLILVLPLTVLVLALCLTEFVLSMRTAVPEVERAESPRDVWPVMLLFAVYVVSLRWLGFDVGTCLFVGVFLYMQGERRRLWLIGYSIAFAFYVTWFFREMLPYPMPTLVIDSITAGGPP